MAYERVNWENLPSTKTPVNADNLNKMDEVLENKVDKVEGKGLSSNDFTDDEKTKLENLNSNLQNYSFDEQIIGSWTNGKPLYRKVFTLSNQASTSSNTDYIDISGLGINELTLFRGILKSSTGGKYIIPFTDSSSNYNVFFVTQTHIRGRFQLGDGGTSANLLFILEYTKTTD